jgi:16S rRNA (cytidine1402-2'-O)-methyltransferase
MSTAPQACGTLYIVATPIGNLGDMSFRALEVLKQVDRIAAEDTRHVRTLLNHYGINNRLLALHQHNEDKASVQLVEQLQQGLSIALVSDAGTPLLSDPGLPLVQRVREAGMSVVPIPGPCALITALCASGLPTSRFTFESFAPRTSSARKAFFNERVAIATTWAFYESSHRILACLQDMASVLEATRQIVIARELTKLHETIVSCSLSEMLERVSTDDNMRKGEFVVIVAGATLETDVQGLTAEQEKVLRLLLRECSMKTAVDLAVELTGVRKKLLYSEALKINQTLIVE